MDPAGRGRAVPAPVAFLDGSIAEVQERLRSRDISPTELLEATIARLEELEPDLNAFTTVLHDTARDQASRAERALLDGDRRGTLAGVPVSLKDLIAMSGVRSPMGSRRFGRYRPRDDAAVLRRLRDAGAVIFGKTNMLELAAGFVHEDFGQSNNPWDTGRTAGGSSSGSAASVAAGIGFGSVGSDTGGSIRLPSALCGIVGLKPTRGRISLAGVFPLSPTLDHVGPLTRSVGDARTLFRVLAEPAPLVDGSAAPPPPTSHPRIGVVTDLLDGVTDEVAERFDAALDCLRQTGARVVEQPLPGLETIAEQAIAILLAEAADQHRTWYPEHEEDYSSGMRANLEAGRRLTALDYLHARQVRRDVTHEVDDAFSTVDILVSPTVAFTAPFREPDFAEALPYVQRTFPFNVSGHPALTVPAPAHSTPSLPVGIQLIAGRHQEDALFAIGEAYERQLDGFRRPWSA